jgi:hypothetical protein
MTATPVGDHEWLYRAIPSNGKGYRMTEEGLRISASAFADRQRRPSVDRSALRTDPADARIGANDGVTRLLTHDVRRIGHIPVAPNDPASARVYTVDVVHRPTSIANGDRRDNPAHCQIEASPSFASDNHFRKLIEALAKLATHQGWVIPPRE